MFEGSNKLNRLSYKGLLVDVLVSTGDEGRVNFSEKPRGVKKRQRSGGVRMGQPDRENLYHLHLNT
jgi:hypothetical protein